MSIASRITSIENHIEEAYTEISRLGVDLTNVDKNIDNIADKLQEAYSQSPKVTDDGSNLSLSPTRKGGLTIIPKGACEQDTTTGKQLFNKNGVTRVNGVITDNNYWVSGENAYSFRIPIQPNTNYTISANNTEETIFRAGVSNTENLPTQRKCSINKCYKIYKY